MGAAERIEWSGEYPALLWSLHPCAGDEVWDAVEPVNDNARRLRLIERRNAPQSEESFPHARAGVLCDNEYRSVEACTPSTRQGEAQLAQAHRAEQAGGWGLLNYRFTGKEEDVEVGLQYFGKRYLNPLLGRWVSVDPLAIHAPGEADLNVYAYVSGQVLRSIDPLGLEASEAQRQVESENNLQNYFDPDSRQNQSYNQSPGGTSPAPGGDGNSYNGDKEYNNGIGDPTAAPFTNPHDPLNGNLGGASRGDATKSTPKGAGSDKWNAASDFAAATDVLTGGANDLDSKSPHASPRGNPGGEGEGPGSTAGQLAYSFAQIAATGVSQIGKAIKWLGKGLKKSWNSVKVARWKRALETAGAVDPKNIRFTQDSIKGSFKGGGSLNETIEGLRTGKVDPNSFPAIRTFVRDGQTFTLDNRRLYVFQRAKMPIRTVPATSEEMVSEGWKFTTKNGGESIRIRGQQ